MHELLVISADEVAAMAMLGSEVPHWNLWNLPQLEDALRQAALLPEGPQLDAALGRIMQFLVAEFPESPGFPPSFFEAYARRELSATTSTRENR
ncbi:MAG: hypothetical protein WD793_10520 [Steroidobacteraceae bacterium]